MTRKVLARNKTGKGVEFINALPQNIYVIIFIIILVSVFLYLYKTPALVARNFFTDEYLKSWLIKDGDKFTIAYTHSVELCPVTESYLIKNNRIILTETYFESYGAGLPATTPYTFEFKDKGFRIYNINTVMDNLVYRTGAVRANHELIYKGKGYKFLSFSKPRTGIVFKINKVSLLAYIVKECF